MTEYEIPLFDLVRTMANAADLISPVVANHHKRVAYIVHRLVQHLGFPPPLARDAVIAASLHDLGAFSLEERTNMLEFEIHKPQQHAELGYAFFRDFRPFEQVARIIRFHHLPWRNGAGTTDRGHDVPEASHLLHLADRVDVISFDLENILSRMDSVRQQIEKQKGALFVPAHVNAFSEISDKEYFWLDLRSPALDEILQRTVDVSRITIDADGVVDLARLLSHLVDFKSQYTSTHTAGVAHTAELLAKIIGLPSERRQQVLLAGYLHDIGKLAVPREILDKPSGLDHEEYGLIKSHAYYTRRIVETISGMSEIADWAASHHEHLDGGGYPFHISDLPLESKIIAVADVFTALAEDRPYRKGLPPKRVRDTLFKMAAERHLDWETVRTLADHQSVIDRAREAAQRDARAEYTVMLDRARSIEGLEGYS